MGVFTPCRRRRLSGFWDVRAGARQPHTEEDRASLRGESFVHDRTRHSRSEARTLRAGEHDTRTGLIASQSSQSPLARGPRGGGSRRRGVILPYALTRLQRQARMGPQPPDQGRSWARGVYRFVATRAVAGRIFRHLATRSTIYRRWTGGSRMFCALAIAVGCPK